MHDVTVTTSPLFKNTVQGFDLCSISVCVIIPMGWLVHDCPSSWVAGIGTTLILFLFLHNCLDGACIISKILEIGQLTQLDSGQFLLFLGIDLLAS